MIAASISFLENVVIWIFFFSCWWWRASRCITYSSYKFWLNFLTLFFYLEDLQSACLTKNLSS